MTTPHSPPRKPALRILYAEDDPQDAELVRLHFAKHAPDCDLEVVGTGQGCLKRLRETGFDALLADYRLCDMTGLDVLKAMVHAGVDVPVVLVTGAGDEELVLKALRLGAVNYLPKVGDYVTTLPGVIRDAVETHRRAQRQGLVATTPRRVLYVEHDPTDVDLTLHHFGEAAPHLAVDVAPTCTDALERLKGPLPYDLVLLDLRMPDMSGLDFVREARRRHLVLPPFIIVSGSGDDVAAIATLKLGAADYVSRHEGYLHELTYTIDHAIAHDRLKRLNDQLRQELAERQRAEELLRESEDRFRATFEQAAVGLAHVAPDGRWLRVNQKLCDILGFTREELLEIAFQDITHPDDLAPDLEAVREMFTGRLAAHVREKRYIRKDGSLVWVEITVSLVRAPSGEPSYFISVTEDISRRRQAEENLRLQSAGLNAAADAMVITDRAGAIVWVNPAFETLTGYTSAEAIGRNPRELVRSGVHTVAFYESLWKTILAGDVWRGEVRNRRKDGDVYPEEMTITPVREANGTISHFIAFKRDLTEQKNLEAQFLQAQKMEGIGRLAGGVAHDFNNMLTVVKGYAELVLEKLAPDDTARADVEEILAAEARSAGLVQQLLAFARKQPIAPQVVNLGDTIGSLLKMTGRLMGEQIELAWMPAHEAGFVYMDPSQIQQIVVNLALNARDAIDGTGRVTVQTANVELSKEYCASHLGSVPGAFVMLVVSDTGCGMDGDTRSRIFDPFFTTKPPGKGTGLGLSTVYGIVKQNGGFINVQSRVGHGTTFRIYLPRYTPEAAPADTAVRSAAPTGTETVLVVEDDPALLRLATRVLERLGYTVLSTASPKEAIRLVGVHQGTLGLVMTDVIMPEMTGPALREQLAHVSPGLKCLFMSGYAADVLGPQGVLGPDIHFIQKPFSADELARKIREVLEA